MGKIQGFFKKYWHLNSRISSLYFLRWGKPRTVQNLARQILSMVRWSNQSLCHWSCTFWWSWADSAEIDFTKKIRNFYCVFFYCGTFSWLITQPLIEKNMHFGVETNRTKLDSSFERMPFFISYPGVSSAWPKYMVRSGCSGSVDSPPSSCVVIPSLKRRWLR